jgi:threonine aldolase
MGGGMRQAGYLAAAGIYALDHHVDRLRIDNSRAKILGKTLESLPWVERVRPVQTNIVIFDIKAPFTATSFLEKLSEKGIKASPFGPMTIRFVTHLDFTESMLERTVEVLKGFEL